MFLSVIKEFFEAIQNNIIADLNWFMEKCYGLLEAFLINQVDIETIKTSEIFITTETDERIPEYKDVYEFLDDFDKTSIRCISSDPVVAAIAKKRREKIRQFEAHRRESDPNFFNLHSSDDTKPEY